IVSTLHSRVEHSLIEQSRRQPTVAAYECVLRGIKRRRGYGPDDNEHAARLFQQAIDLDLSYALAYDAALQPADTQPATALLPGLPGLDVQLKARGLHGPEVGFGGDAAEQDDFGIGQAGSLPSLLEGAAHHPRVDAGRIAAMYRRLEHAAAVGRPHEVLR